MREVEDKKGGRVRGMEGGRKGDPGERLGMEEGKLRLGREGEEAFEHL